MGTKWSEFVSSTSVPATAQIVYSYNGGNYRISKSAFDADITVPPAGSTTQLQYNNAGTLAGTAGVLWSANSLIVDRGYKFLPRGQATNETVNIGNTSGSAGATAVVIGGNASVNFTDGVAVGYDADVSATRTVSIGRSTDATGQYAIALGYYAQAAANQFVVGANTNVTTMKFGDGSAVVTVTNPLTLVIRETGTADLSVGAIADGQALIRSGTTITSSAFGDVVGPGSSTDNAVARFDSTTGKLIQNSSVIIDDSNNVSGIVNTTQTGYKDLNGIAAPATPASGYGRLYVQSDDTALHFVDDTGLNVHIGPTLICKSETMRNAASGTHYLFGYYNAPAADANLNQGSASITLGSANVPYWAHAFIVAGAAGTVDTGTVALRITGTSIDNNGTRTGSDTEDIVADITALSTDEFIQSEKKWLGQVTIALVGTGGSPTTYSLDFNYGFARYADYGGRKFSLRAFECEGKAGANDTSFDIEVLHHKTTGWTYHATAFVPGATAIAKLSTDASTESDLVNGEPFSYKRLNLNENIDGTIDEGVILRVTTGTNNSVDFMNAHIGFYQIDF